MLIKKQTAADKIPWQFAFLEAQKILRFLGNTVFYPFARKN